MFHQGIFAKRGRGGCHQNAQGSGCAQVCLVTRRPRLRSSPGKGAESRSAWPA